MNLNDIQPGFYRKEDEVAALREIICLKTITDNIEKHLNNGDFDKVQERKIDYSNSLDELVKMRKTKINEDRKLLYYGQLNSQEQVNEMIRRTKGSEAI